MFPHLKSVVEREPVEENIGEELAKAEDTIDHPVRQPFCVVFFVYAFDGFDSADMSGNSQKLEGFTLLKRTFRILEILKFRIFFLFRLTALIVAKQKS